MKYEFLFTALTLGIFFLVEVFSRARVHMVQYILVGSALVMFYLLILSLSEHLSFAVAYALASLGVVALVWGYARAVFDEASQSAVVGSVLSLLYGFLFVLLAAQDYSLLMGSLGLFLVLASVMFFTRDVDWYALGERSPAEGGRVGGAANRIPSRRAALSRYTFFRMGRDGRDRSDPGFDRVRRRRHR